MGREITLYDTRTRRPQRLEPRDPGRVGIYACGPTVYSRVHVGNARPYVTFLLLKRFLEHEGYEVSLVVNVTDVNDKIYTAAATADVASDALAREMTAAYVADTDRLGLGRPDHEPLASETIGPIVALISDLVEGERAYEAGGDVYFRVRSLPAYGELSRRDLAEMDQGEGVEGAERKEDPLDFALWKAEKAGEDTAWESPWGRGRPGWHIECSAMAEQLLGLRFDIHGGGVDLVFPHHENEAAQTLAARGVPLARLWMHNGMVQLGAAGPADPRAPADADPRAPSGADADPRAPGADANPSAPSDADADPRAPLDADGGGEKMSKSLGNIRGLAEVLDEVGRDALVLYFCAGHYRQPLAFSRERLQEAARGVERIRDAGRRLERGDSPAGLAHHREAFFAALADDFNTARALAAAYDWIRAANREGGGVGDADLREMLGVLGLEALLDPTGLEAPAGVEALARDRAEARARRDFAEADRLRDELRARGWEVRDGAAGPELVPISP